MRINYDNNSFKGLSTLQKPLGIFYNPKSVLPILAIETGVTIGRSIQAKKRGGTKEAVNRFVEQGASAVVWIWGVQALQKAGEFIGEKLFHLDLDFDIGSEYIKKLTKNDFAKNYKVANILLSTLLATAFIGFMLPKISMKIAKKRSAKEEQNKTQIKSLSFEKFQNKTNNQNSKNINFKSLGDYMLNLAGLIENNPTARLFITDTGVVTGRCYNAKSIYRKIENLFRDISSIYFYLFSTSHIVKLLNKLTNTSDIDPKALNKVVPFLTEKTKNQTQGSSEFLEKTKNSIDKEFLNEIHNEVIGKNILNNNRRFSSEKRLNKINNSVFDFVEKLAKTNNSINEKTIVDFANKNIRRNLLYYVGATAFSIYALATLIPKIQYAITKKMTNKDEFRE